MDFRLKLLAGTLAFALSAASHAADPIKIGVAGPTPGLLLDGREHARRRTPGDRGNQQERRRAGPSAGRGGARRRGQERARRADRPGADQQGTGHRHRRLHQYRRGPGLAALLPRRQDPGVQQRGHGQRHHAPVQGARVPGQLRVPQRGPRQHPGADDRRGSHHPPRLQESGDPGRLHQLWPARPRGPGKGPGRQGHQAGGRGEVQHQGRGHDGPAAQVQEAGAEAC